MIPIRKHSNLSIGRENMKNPVSEAKNAVSALVDAALSQAMSAGDLPGCDSLPPFVTEIPADCTHGDFASNAAMVCARPLKAAPRKIAEAVVSHLSLAGTPFERVEIAGPGFINFFLAPAWYAETVQAVLEGGGDYGRTDEGNHEKVQVE